MHDTDFSGTPPEYRIAMENDNSQLALSNQSVAEPAAQAIDGRYNLLEDLDSRQNQLMADLDKLNEDILSVLKEWTVCEEEGAILNDAA